MAGRANWEDKIKSIFTSNKIQKPQDKAVEASKHLGTGMADSAASNIRSYKEKQEKALREAGL